MNLSPLQMASIERLKTENPALYAQFMAEVAKGDKIVRRWGGGQSGPSGDDDGSSSDNDAGLGGGSQGHGGSGPGGTSSDGGQSGAEDGGQSDDGGGYGSDTGAGGEGYGVGPDGTMGTGPRGDVGLGFDYGNPDFSVPTNPFSQEEMQEALQGAIDGRPGAIDTVMGMVNGILGLIGVVSAIGAANPATAAAAMEQLSHAKSVFSNHVTAANAKSTMDAMNNPDAAQAMADAMDALDGMPSEDAGGGEWVEWANAFSPTPAPTEPPRPTVDANGFLNFDMGDFSGNPYADLIAGPQRGMTTTPGTSPSMYVDPALLNPAAWRQGVDPAEAAYLTANPDVAQAVQDGSILSGLDHYNQFGRDEGRQWEDFSQWRPERLTHEATNLYNQGMSPREIAQLAAQHGVPYENMNYTFGEGFSQDILPAYGRGMTQQANIDPSLGERYPWLVGSTSERIYQQNANEQLRKAIEEKKKMQQSPLQMAAGGMVRRYAEGGAVSDDDIRAWFEANPDAHDGQIKSVMGQYGVTPERLSSTMGIDLGDVQGRYSAATDWSIATPDQLRQQASAMYEAGMSPQEIAAKADEFYVPARHMSNTFYEDHAEDVRKGYGVTPNPVTPPTYSGDIRERFRQISNNRNTTPSNDQVLISGLSMDDIDLLGQNPEFRSWGPSKSSTEIMGVIQQLKGMGYGDAEVGKYLQQLNVYGNQFGGGELRTRDGQQLTIHDMFDDPEAAWKGYSTGSRWWDDDSGAWRQAGNINYVDSRGRDFANPFMPRTNPYAQQQDPNRRATGEIIDPTTGTPVGTESPLSVVQPPVTQPPVTQPPVTQPPVTQPPVTQPPVTQDTPYTYQPAPLPTMPDGYGMIPYADYTPEGVVGQLYQMPELPQAVNYIPDYYEWNPTNPLQSYDDSNPSWWKQNLVNYNQQYAAGGPVAGPGTGRSDEIPALLSDGEFVIDAETVALLGDGSTEAGAMILEQLREEIRRHKGAAMANGEHSPDAMSPLQYLQGAM